MVDVAVTGAGGHDAEIALAAGGSSANAVAWAAALGADVTVVGRVGADAAGRLVRDSLEERGVRALLATDPAAPTGVFLVLADAGGRRVFAARGANARLSADDLPAAIEADAVLVSGYLLLEEGSGAAARAAVERARAEWVAVDAGSRGVIESSEQRLLELAGGASALLANDDEARALTGSGPEEAARLLAERHRLVCVKRGAAGAVGVLDGHLESVPAPAIEAADPTGAGDAFAAGLLLALARRAPLREALSEGCRCGALAAASPTRWPTGA